MGSGVRVGRAVGVALASWTVAAGGSKGVGGRKRPAAERATESGTVRVWDGSIVNDGSNEPLFVVLPVSGTIEASGTASVYFWFLPDIVGGGVGVGSAVKWLAGKGIGVGDSVSKGVGVKDGRGGNVMYMVGGS